jgi:hypothetical protein
MVLYSDDRLRIDSDALSALPFNVTQQTRVMRSKSTDGDGDRSVRCGHRHAGVSSDKATFSAAAPLPFRSVVSLSTSGPCTP